MTRSNSKRDSGAPAIGVGNDRPWSASVRGTAGSARNVEQYKRSASYQRFK